MICLGFCWITFFAFLMGRYFSEKQYRVRDFLLVIVTFYAVKFLFLATLAHPLLQLTCGDAYRLFVKGLSDIGITDSPWKIYMQHFNKVKWAEVIIGGRNYFTTVNIISSVAGTLAVMGTVLLILKDKLTAKLMLLVCSALAVSILAADVFHILGSGGYHLNTFTPPQWLKNNSWGYWEYFTGFFAGLSITGIFVIQDKKISSKGAEISEILPDIGRYKCVSYIYFLIVFCAGALSAGIVRAIASRLDQHGIFSEAGIPMGITIPILAIPAFIIFAVVLYRNIIKKKLGQPFNADFKTFALSATPIIFSIFTFIDLCVAYTCWDELPRFGINFLVGLSLVMVIAGYLVLRKALKSSTKA